jgi:hypothetical protein
VTETSPEKSKKGRYYISDIFTAFWFRFVHPYRSDLMRDIDAYAMKRFDTDFVQRHVSFVFEDICRDFVRRCPDRIGFVPERVGRYWDADTEIDILAIDRASGRAFAGECRYSQSPVGRHELSSLRGKVSRARELDGFSVTYGLFSLSGFDGIDDPDVLLFTASDAAGNRRRSRPGPRSLRGRCSASPWTTCS